ncbi:chemotaxis protein CheR [Methylophaga lonarensis MPL]|uniref:Chemotaxis protein methyltransferase n=1 Tax=Methylophaga lonarensis MPL TaxID=1286106 RepID=M7P194_9GAMM|nr:protein-glutamate O-methyltransferase CheR [Methylophaga lonarensis]EMR13251.1 chemotaxis protein CheR [Methylophaga lonarensis MPL]
MLTEELAHEFDFPDVLFERIRSFALQHTGINLSDAKKNMVYSRLSRRVRSQFSGSFQAFCEALDADDPDTCEFLINALTTNLTAFFREKHHFDFLAQQWLPQLRQTQPQQRRLRIWSAGCSTGEEPYSIAISLLEAMPDIEQWDVRILATDLDANVIASAQQGVYDGQRVQAMPVDQVRRWFQRGVGKNSGLVRVREEVRKRVTFRRLNLLHDWPMRGPFDLIFCRNVVIYFDKETQKTLFDRYANVLSDTGYLFIGHSENLFQVTERFRSLGQTVYCKVA